jgi:hypothetical protein
MDALGPEGVMSIEPNARLRLELVCATTRDLQLVKDLRQVLEEERMSFVPSAELLRDIALCGECIQDEPRSGRAGLCEEHRTRWNLQACMATSASEQNPHDSLTRLAEALLMSPDGGAQLLSALDQQRRALRLVWEAHARGAVQLPESIAATVERAYVAAPRFLSGGSRSAVQHAS